MEGDVLSMNKTYTNAFKGLAIIFVILCHAAGTFGEGKFTLFTPLGGIGVAIFLFLSAYGLNESWSAKASEGKKPYEHWWRKRFISVWIPYIVVQLIAYWPFNKFSVIPFILDLTMIKPLYHNGWYLQYLFLLYVLFYAVKRIRVIEKYHIFVFGAISLILFFTTREIMAEQSISFLFGILLSERKQVQKYLFRIRFGIIFTGFGVACLAVKQLPVVRAAPQIIINLVQLGIKFPIALGSMILFYTLFKKANWIAVVLGAVGAVSYELYLIHGYILSIPIMPINIYGVLIFVGITSAASVCYWWIIKKTKPLLFKVFRIT